VACVYTEKEEEKEDFASEREAYTELGLPLCEAPECQFHHGYIDTVAMAGQGRFHPVEFLASLASAAMGLGAQMFEGSPATEIEEIDGGVQFKVDNHSIHAQQMIVATHYPIYDSGFFIAKLAPYRSYAMAIRPQQRPQTGMYISNESELHSWRPHGDDILIVGAGCHKVGQEPDTPNEYRKLQKWAKQKFGEYELLAKWSAQDNATHDELPYVGRSPGKNHIYVATGFDGWGMSNGIAAAKLMCDLISGEENLLAETLDPGRLSLKGFGKFTAENLDAVGHLTADRFRKVTDGQPEDLRPGQAGVFAAGGMDRVAAYRDDDGVLHECSAICPHFGCQVAWNSAEKSWDCPCHGSRFDQQGRVIQSPAMSDLAPVQKPAPQDQKRKLM
jgi:nitrite reductase/ring-hydroxylating ferredoxin subunit